MVPSITGGGGGLEFKKLNASDISGVMSNPATADLLMKTWNITFGNSAPTMIIGNNTFNQLMIKTSAQGDTVNSASAPTILVDSANGTLYHHGIPQRQITNVFKKFTVPTSGPYNRPPATISSTASAPASGLGVWTDLGTITTLRYDDAAFGSGGGVTWTWVPVATEFDSNYPNVYLIVPGTTKGGVQQTGFRYLPTDKGISQTNYKISVDCNIVGGLWNPSANTIVGAFINNGSFGYSDPSGGANGTSFTYNYTITVGILKRTRTGTTSWDEEDLCSQDFSVPFGKHASRTVNFSCNFSFIMETGATNSTANGAIEYVPYFNHNGCTGGGGGQAQLRYVNGISGHTNPLSVTFTCKELYRP
jgi:hypothetical protein